MNLKPLFLALATASLIATPALAGAGADTQPVMTSPDTPNAPHNATTYDNGSNLAKDEAAGQVRHVHKKHHRHHD
jgi:hypothetical protein